MGGTHLGHFRQWGMTYGGNGVSKVHALPLFLAVRMLYTGYPLITPIGTVLTTLREMPALWVTSTTSLTSL